MLPCPVDILTASNTKDYQLKVALQVAFCISIVSFSKQGSMFLRRMRRRLTASALEGRVTWPGMYIPWYLVASVKLAGPKVHIFVWLEADRHVDDFWADILTGVESSRMQKWNMLAAQCISPVQECDDANITEQCYWGDIRQPIRHLHRNKT